MSARTPKLVRRAQMRESFVTMPPSKKKEFDSKSFPRVQTAVRRGACDEVETLNACTKIQESLLLRAKYQGILEGVSGAITAPDGQCSFSLRDGVYTALVDGEPLLGADFPSSDTFLDDFHAVEQTSVNGPVKTLTYQRLKQLELRFRLHKTLNGDRELDSTQDDVRDFFNIVKVDTHIHLAAAMTPSMLLDFIKEKCERESDVIVNKLKDGTEETLEAMMKRLMLDPNRLTVDSLDVHGDNTFQRFDNFNNKYNPFGKAELRAVFLKSSNVLEGRYFAEITKQMLEVNEKEDTVATEFRISIYGRSNKEWDQLSKWVLGNKLRSKQNRWLIQVPRIFSVWNKFAGVESFQVMLDNIFKPLFEVTLDPSSNPQLNEFLLDVSGFDSVDDESKMEMATTKDAWKSPEQWCDPVDPPYAYYMYYMWANIAQLNALREAKGLPGFSLRPHCGESGAVHHLASAFLLANHVNHGINLVNNTPLQYLYYLAQVGLAVSPLSNNNLFLDYRKNPFDTFFQRGLNVSLSTDDPLQFHYTQSPLIEEYTIAAQNWGYNTIDCSEIASNSVLQSGFEDDTKARWLGPDFQRVGVAGNNVEYSNVPDIRVAYRHETLQQERKFVASVAHAATQQNSDPQKKREMMRATLNTADLEWNTVEIINPSGGSVPIVDSEEVAAAYQLYKLMSLRRKYVRIDSIFHPDPTIEQRADIPLLADADPEEFSGVEMNKGVFGFLHRGAQPLYAEAPDKLPREANLLNALKEQAETADDDASSSASPSSSSKFVASVTGSLLGSLESVGGDDEALLEDDYWGLVKVPSFEEFRKDFCAMVEGSAHGPTVSFCYRRLKILDDVYRFHEMANRKLEKEQAQRTVSDFYRSNKVDNHVHVASAPTSEHLLTFIKRTVEKHGDDVVHSEPYTNGNDEDGQEKGETLNHVLRRIGLDAHRLSIDSLNVSASDTFKRFDKFNAKYNPFGSSELRTIFLKRDNSMQGRFLGNLLGEVFEMQRKAALYRSEYRVSVYGRDENEWERLAEWDATHKLSQYGVNRFLVQVPRTYFLLHPSVAPKTSFAGTHAEETVSSFGQFLRNLFGPLFEATLYPRRYPKVARLLENISGFDSVDDEGRPERNFGIGEYPAPDDWTSAENPPYAYYMYYMWANITALNNLRKLRRMNTFDFRPHSGVAGNIDHLAAAFLVSNGIAHGIQLSRSPVYQFLYYLRQVPVSVSPLAENSIHCRLPENPFPKFFRRGLNVALSTDNPLQLHFTPEPLIEEYAICAQVFKLSSVDMSELARNSVIGSGFEESLKVRWIGENFRTGYDPNKTNVPPIRRAFREDRLNKELQLIFSIVDNYIESGALKEHVKTLAPILGLDFSKKTSSSGSNAAASSSGQSQEGENDNSENDPPLLRRMMSVSVERKGWFGLRKMMQQHAFTPDNE